MKSVMDYLKCEGDDETDCINAREEFEKDLSPELIEEIKIYAKDNDMTYDAAFAYIIVSSLDGFLKSNPHIVSKTLKNLKEDFKNQDLILDSSSKDRYETLSNYCKRKK